ncbi:Urb2/Npa2 family-domain-containing protein [Hypoxylon cercidicola]|nr:Urb2/Npa2 family-domain-containing protein [Hypoxylon cercidicola]
MEVDSDSGSRRLALIKAVRSLDEDNTITLPDKIQRIWDLLSATKNTRLHAVEENILRWLFKHMSGTTEDAEQVRRYPLTWSILSHVFPKIPSQTLGRSLASLRFVSVLRKTVGDITTAQKKPTVSPVQTNGVEPEKTKKRKRDNEFPSDIEELRTPQGCIKSATAVFAALDSLFNQGDRRAAPNAPERRVGAEHIKSLFSSSNEETRDIAAGLILTCDRSLSVLESGISRYQKSWVGTIAALWNLRPHNKDDSIEFARHMCVPVCSILTRLRGILDAAPVVVTSNTVKERWIRQLEQLLGAYLIRPARHAFATDGNVDVLQTALAVTKRNIGGSAIAMWDVAARTPRDSSDPKSKAEHSSWARSAFQTFLDAIKSLETPNLNQVVTRILYIAIQADSVPDTATLRALCKSHALGPGETDWELVAKIIACDPDVFLMEHTLMEIAFDRMSSYSNQHLTKKETIVTNIILPLEDAFAKARNLPGFIRKWYDLLCETPKNILDQTIWVDSKIRERLASLVQGALTSTQLLRVLENLESLDDDSGARLIVLDGISAGITEEEYINVADPVIFSKVFEGKTYENLSSSILSLRWRIAGRMASWETSDDVDRLRAELKSTLHRILKKGALEDPETFEAFSCYHKLWLANHPGSKHETDLAKRTCSFIERLTSEMQANNDLSTFEPYVDYVFRHLPKLTELPGEEANRLRNLIVNLFWHVGKRFTVGGDARYSDLLRLLLHNFDCEDEESLVDALISQPLDAVDSAEVQSGWTQPQSLSLLSTLLEFPQGAFTKGRRKRIMSSWKKWRSAITDRASQDQQFVVAVLRLLIKVTQQPTFYEDMEFNDLVYLSCYMVEPDKTVLSLIEKLIDLTLGQIVASTDGPSQAYLSDASHFVKNLEPAESVYAVPLMLIAKGLVSALYNSASSKPQNSISLDDAAHKLARMVDTNLSTFAYETELLSKTQHDGSSLLLFSLTLSAANCVAEVRGAKPIKLSEDTISQLEKMSASYVSSGSDIGWKLREFLLRNCPDRYDTVALLTQLEQSSGVVDEDLVYNLVDAFVKTKDQTVRGHLLNELVGSTQLTAGPIGPLLAVRRLVEQYLGPNTKSNEGILDLAAVHDRLASLLSQAESLRHFKHLSDTLLLLLDKHANSMTQFNIETTLSSVVHVCSRTGPKIHTPKAAGEIYNRLHKLVALVLKRHRLRLSGHFPILLTALRALLTTLLADPSSPATRATSPQARYHHPPWLASRLQARHAERFARLLTLICEPSAASVARARPSELDSATDAAKRAAGRDVLTVVELYVKLQLESTTTTTTVPRDIRKALEPGIYAALDVTPQGGRRVLNESLDANGRAVFRSLFADYKKFGKWSGV